jgi:TRAP transporter TAXI family solute receptor
MKTLFKAVAAAAIVACSAVGASAQTYSIEGAGASSLTGIVPQSLAQFAAREGITLQVVLGQTLTRSALNVAAGRLDMAVIPPPAYAAMRAGAGPYAQQGEQAKELSKNVRSLFGFPGGTFHAIVWADSGIENWSDIAGKRVYVGPPAGAANAQIQGMVELASGFEAGSDYEPMRAPWEAGMQSFQDGQFDVFVTSVAVGQQSLNELSLLRPIRILGVSQEIVGSPEWDQYTQDLAVLTAEIPAGTYSGQVNGEESLQTAQTAMMVGVGKDFPEEAAYKVTKAYWENLPAMKEGNALMRPIDETKPFDGLNAPLHPGAIRYYEEAGIDIPAELAGE